ncbi:MAG: hypothetical protein JRN50_04325, partial [Nitrososphaerota archaeon]|nr:hypothetical protein [Nitrososphaerota archaeon]
IWVMIMPEDGGAPKIPRNVEDAKSERVFYEITGRGTALLALAGRLEELAGRGANPPSRRRVRGAFR